MARTTVSVAVGTAIERDGNTVVLHQPNRTIHLSKLPPGALTLFDRLTSAPSGVDCAELAALPEQVVARLEPLLRYGIEWDNGAVAATLETMVPTQRHDPAPVTVAVQLSRFACLRRDDNGLILESPLSTRRLRVGHPAVGALLTALATPHAPASLARDVHPEAPALLAHLLAAGFLDEGCAEPASLRQWEFHDLLFHWRSRRGRHDHPVGGTFPFLGQIGSAPVVRPLHPGPRTPLVTPELDDIARADPPFTTVLESRRSTRAHDGEPITVEQLGEFLYRSARVRELREDESKPYPTSSRPYPSGGATYDLELYLTVHRCTGLAGGIYHYDPLGHQLVGLGSEENMSDRLLADARASIRSSATPDVLITLTSRFQRLSWKYRGMAYAAILKNVGALYQTMYLVATAMNLCACALGAGNAELSAQTFGVDYTQESSVGEFLLGGSARSSRK